MSHPLKSPLHQPGHHESAERHVTGEALYVDDLPEPRGMLVAQPVFSPHAHAKILKRDKTAAEKVPGIHAVLMAEDVPGENSIGAVFHDEPLFAETEVLSEGQVVALVVGESYAACRKAIAAMQVEYEVLPAILSTKEAVAKGSFHSEPHVMKRGDVEAVLASAPVRITGEIENGGQEHFYLESHAALAVPEEGGTFRVYSSTQHPSEVQAKVAEILHIHRQSVTVEVPRMGGGFGGKETQGNHWAAMAALAAQVTGRAVKVWLNRDIDMVCTGKRHPFFTTYDAAFDAQGNLLGLKVFSYANGGWATDLSIAISDRALFHMANCYWVPALYFEGRVAKTNTASNTAFRGFGGPQGMLVIEEILNRAAERLNLEPAELRRCNYLGEGRRNRTPYDQEVKGFRLPRMHEEILRTSEYLQRRADAEAFNASSEWVKRGIAFQPVQFGISFTTSFLNQAGALVLIYADGSVQLNHGGTEMGQGLHTKMLAVAAHELGVPLSRIRAMTTATDKVPNTSATAASSGSDLNGQAVAEACKALRERLRPVAAKVLKLSEAEAQGLVFEDGKIHLPGRADASVAFEKVVNEAYLARISLSATGYYATPDIWYDRANGRGKPFHYFAYGAAVTEVEVNGLTGEHRVTRCDILHDVGTSLTPDIDRGQVEGAFIQGLGWLTCEELVWNAKGQLVTHSPSTYKIPAIGEAPEDFRVALLPRSAQEGVIHGSKAVGEPPFMLAISVLGALRHAVQGFASQGYEVKLAIPATPEAILRSVEEARAAKAETEREVA